MPEHRQQAPASGRGTTASAATVADMYERLAQEGCDEMVRDLRAALGAEPAVLVWERMAAKLEGAAGVLAFLGGGFDAAAHLRDEMVGQARALVTLAGRLEEAADRARR